MTKTNLNIGDLVLYKNNQLIAFNKPVGIAVQNDKTGDKSLLNLAEIYCKCPLFLIHRLDRPASGVILFAKSKKALANLNLQFQDRTIEKKYLAVVRNEPLEKSATLTHFVQKDQKTNRSFASDEEKRNSKKAILSYQQVGEIDNYQLLEIDLQTGRHHQIRAQLAAINHPIKGDVKYGFKRGNKDRSIHLHAWKLTFKHPVSKEKVILEAPVPSEDPVWNAFEI